MIYTLTIAVEAPDQGAAAKEVVEELNKNGCEGCWDVQDNPEEEEESE